MTLMYRSARPISARRKDSSKRRRLNTPAPVPVALVPTYRGYNPQAFSRGEWKYLDIALTQDYNSTMSLTLLNGLVPGTGASQRVGMKIIMKSIEMRANLKTTDAAGVEQFIRAFLILDKQANGAAPAAITDILNAASVNGLRQLTNRKRFKILYDKEIAFGSKVVSTGSPTSRILKLYMKFKKPIIVDYNSGVAGTIADITTNALYWVTYGTEAAGGTDVEGRHQFRLRYTDN